MILDIILIVVIIFMMIYGYKKGCISIVTKLVATLIAFVLSYILADEVGKYISNTSIGNKIQTSIQTTVANKINDFDGITAMSIIQDKLNLQLKEEIIQKIIDYVFLTVGFISIFIVTKIVLWIIQWMLENIFELPVLKTFNKLGGVVSATILVSIEILIVLGIIKSLSAFSCISGIFDIINKSVITKAIYEHNIFDKLIISKII